MAVNKSKRYKDLDEMASGKNTSSDAVIEPEVVIEEPEVSNEMDEDPLLGGSTVDREYAKGNSTGYVNEEIPEQEFNAPPIEDIEEIEDDYEEPLGPSFEPGDTGNPKLGDAPNKTKNKASEHMADTILAAYIQLHELAKNNVKISDEKLKNMALKGDIDMGVLNYELSLDDNDPTQTQTVREFLDALNEIADETFTVDDKFIENARPLLIEVCKTNNWGLTPSQRLAFLFLEDAGPKIATLFAFKKQVSQILAIASASYKKDTSPVNLSDQIRKQDAKNMNVDNVTPNSPEDVERQMTIPSDERPAKKTNGRKKQTKEEKAMQIAKEELEQAGNQIKD